MANTINTNPKADPATNGPEKYDLDRDGKISQDEYDKMTEAEKDQYEKDPNTGFYSKKKA
jgi:hypothetical protein